MTVFLLLTHIHNASERDGAQTNDAFEDAPSLRRVVLTVSDERIWPFSFMLPWDQLTSLTLNPVSMSVFPECIRNCPRLLFFHAVVSPRPGEMVSQMTELSSPLRKLVLEFFHGCPAPLLANVAFPNMVSLSLNLYTSRPSADLLAFLARSSRLEMVAVSGWHAFMTMDDLLAVLLATPSLRILHFKESGTAVVMAKFYYKPLVVADQDDPFVQVEPSSLVELDVEACTLFTINTLRAMIEARMDRFPTFDRHGIEKARLLIDGVQFDQEAELEHLLT
ncbi:hypothetical protein B0H10DRAFT_2217426 [Mycena sp. CBHHK59/15]|nr:hypothetical protein B0H10DRAFT_2217426 [Mycena sp. CBHHK59/15]